MVSGQPFGIQCGAILTAAIDHLAMSPKASYRGIAHGLLQGLLEQLGVLFLSDQRGIEGHQFGEGCHQCFVLAEIDHGVLAGVQAAQGTRGGFRTIGRRFDIVDDVLPEARFQHDQATDDLLVPLDAVDAQLLPAQQHRHIRCRLARHRQLVLDLQLDVLRYSVLPHTRTELARGLALQDLHVRRADDLTVDVRQHVREGRVLQDGVEPPHPMAGLLLIGRRHQRFQQGAPVAGIVLPGRCFFDRLAAGLLLPEFQLALVGVQAHGRGGIRTANATVAHFQPLVAVERARIDQA